MIEHYSLLFYERKSSKKSLFCNRDIKDEMP